jgi:hypothetical protein
MRFRLIVSVALALAIISVWWFWPLIAWFRLGTAVRSAFSARKPVTITHLPNPPDSWTEIQFGPIVASLPVSEIRTGFCLKEYLSCIFNLNGYSAVFDLDWPEPTDSPLATYEEALELFSFPAPSFFSSRAVNSHSVELATILADPTAASFFTTARVSTFAAADLRGIYVRKAKDGAWATFYPSTGAFRVTVTMVGPAVDYGQAIAILGGTRLAPQLLSTDQLEFDRDAINRRWRGHTL